MAPTAAPSAPTLLASHDVARLQVTMHHAVTMRVIERIGELDGVSQDLIDWQRSADEALGLCRRFDVFEHEEVDAALVSDVVQVADVRVIQACNGPGLPVEARFPVPVAGQVGRKHFDGDGPMEAGVGRAVDFTHPPSAQQALNLVKGPGASRLIALAREVSYRAAWTTSIG